MLEIETNLVQTRVPVAEIGFEDHVLDAGGLGRRIRAFRLPDANPHRHVRVSRRIGLRREGDNALFIRVTLEDGNLLWSSPIYLLANDGRQTLA
jgi:hypothetical protein